MRQLCCCSGARHKSCRLCPYSIVQCFYHLSAVNLGNTRQRATNQNVGCTFRLSFLLKEKRKQTPYSYGPCRTLRQTFACQHPPPRIPYTHCNAANKRPINVHDITRYVRLTPSPRLSKHQRINVSRASLQTCTFKLLTPVPSTIPPLPSKIKHALERARHYGVSQYVSCRHAPVASATRSHSSRPRVSNRGTRKNCPCRLQD